MGSASRANGEALEAALDAERAAGREPDPRSCAAVEIAERYALGNADDRELRAAYAADAADGAARASALVCHSRAVARGACAAGVAARSAQVARLIQIIEENEP